MPPEFVLYRSTAIALHLGHRESGDFDFFGLPGIPRLAAPFIAPDIGLKVASLLDLAAMKVSVVQRRAEAKDYIDIDAMLGAGVIDLPTALSAGAAVYGRSFNPQITLKALSYFADGNLAGLPNDMKDRLARAVREVDLDRLPSLNPDMFHYVPDERRRL